LARFADDDVARFWAAMQEEFAKVARYTRGDYKLESVQAEAWLIIADLREQGVELDLSCPEHQQMVWHLVRKKVNEYLVSGRILRYAARLDHALGDDPDSSGTLADTVASADSWEPLPELLRAEEPVKPEIQYSVSSSLAAAYVHLLRRLDNDMGRLAAYLLISLSHCYRCCKRARDLAEFQNVLPDPVSVDGVESLPRPWRAFRVERVPVQLSLDLGEEPLLMPALAA